jgi:hypothetical protein
VPWEARHACSDLRPHLDGGAQLKESLNDVRVNASYQMFLSSLSSVGCIAPQCSTLRLAPSSSLADLHLKNPPEPILNRCRFCLVFQKITRYLSQEILGYFSPNFLHAVSGFDEEARGVNIEQDSRLFDTMLQLLKDGGEHEVSTLKFLHACRVVEPSYVAVLLD